MRTTSSRKVVFELAPPLNAAPEVGAGKMCALSSACALGLRNGSVLALNGVKIGWSTLCGWVEFGLQVGVRAVGLMNGVLRACPALAKSVCCAAVSWNAQGACRPELGIATLSEPSTSGGRKPVKLPP